jgi:predicted nucleic acid-binding protein
VDTSVWIDYLGGAVTGVVERFAEILDRGYPVGLASIVYQEAVQGVSSREEFDRTSEYLNSQAFYHPKDPIEHDLVLLHHDRDFENMAGAIPELVLA